MSACARTPPRARERLCSLRRIGFFFAAFGLGFLYAVSASPLISGFNRTLELLVEQLTTRGGSGNWYPSRFSQTGVLRCDPARTQAGYTLYTVAPDLSAHLIDMNGREMHRWKLSRNRIMPGASPDTVFGILQPQIEAGHFYPNGDLLLIYEQNAMGAAHTLLVKVDKNSNVLWTSGAGVHHSIEVFEDRIYALTGTIRWNAIIDAFHMPYIDESVSILDSRGNTLSTHSILQAIANSTRTGLADEIPSDRIDRLHSNSLDVLTGETARFIPGAKPGDVLLSLRNLHMLVVMDLETEKIVWALRGGWRSQHDAKMLANGHILLFDNRGDLTNGRSRVLEVNPRTGGIIWSYDGASGDALDSEYRGGSQRLADGNTLISESTAGRILEVAADGSIVWEYVSPLQREEKDHRLVGSLGLNVIRFDDLRFLPDSIPDAAACGDRNHSLERGNT